MKSFNVLIENNGKFEPYDIMPYLKSEWKSHVETIAQYGEDEYWRYPKTYKEIKNWITKTLKYRYWARCEYELILSTWPSYTNERGEEIIRTGSARKIDIWDQCEMNLDLIVRMFIEDIYLVSIYEE